MKHFLAILGLAALTAFNAPAQVDIELVMDQEQFLPSESIPVAVKITNHSGQPLHFGADADWLTFSVEGEDSYVVVKNSEVPVTGDFDLESSQMAIKHVDLQPYFVLSKPGRYHVTATLSIKNWAARTTSPPKYFDVIRGVDLWTQDFGMPLAAGETNAVPEMRKYTLIEANYLKAALRLYVQVSDETASRIFKVSTVGPMVSFSHPTAQVDRLGQLHVLYQSGGQAFTYAVVAPGGDIVQREIYDYITTLPRLSVNANGDVVVLGGIRRMKPGELPVIRTPIDLPAPAKPKQ